MAKKAIIADDDPSVSKLFETIITRTAKGAEVYTTDNPDELLKEVSKGGYSLVITDYDMKSYMTGVDAVRTIRARDIAVPVYVASGGSEMANAALRAGATGYVMKGRGDTLETIVFLAEKYLSESSGE